MDNTTNTIKAQIAQVTGRTRSAFAMPTCGHAAAWTRVDSAAADMGLVQGYFPGNPAWRPPIS